MKRYMLFSGNEHYPGKGWEDFRGDFNTVQEAKDELLNNPILPREWYQIVDTESGTIEVEHG